LDLLLLQGISTAVWLDRVDAIRGGAANGGRLSLAQHLDEALAQAAAAGKPALVTIVVYDLPNRCRQRCRRLRQRTCSAPKLLCQS
jgi:cellulase/cellobiase CelA1